MVDKLKVAVLGATGLVGQRFIQLLCNHPWFEINYIAASQASIGKRYKDSVTWLVETPLPENIGNLTIQSAEPEAIPKNIDIVFSALPSNVAEKIELSLAKRGFTVVSNSSPLRLEPDIPLINPEVNWDHLKLIKVQKKKRKWKGVIIKNPNCTTAILTLSLKPLLEEFGLRKIIVTTLQAVSGAGLRGVPSILIIDNIIPFIKGEEEKVENESMKILGKLENDSVKPASISISAMTTRVPVIDGHLEVVHVELLKEHSVNVIADTLKMFKSKPQELSLPTAPQKPIIVRFEEDRPQPRLDRLEGKGMSIVVGRISKAAKIGGKWIKYIVLGHNTIRGAAGSAILVAELYVKLEGMI